MGINRYYKLPLQLNTLFQAGKQQLQQCNEIESIDQHLELLLTTCPGEHRFDENYGSRIWELDFGMIASYKTWEEFFTKYVNQTIASYEPRITDASVTLNIKEIMNQEEIPDRAAVRKRADIYITAQVKSTGEHARFAYSLYLSPLSNE
ncbi:MAG: GPW/gp25 family protein [Bacteroidales bacterium]